MLLNLVIGLSLLSMLTSFRLFNKPMMQRRLTMSTATTFLDQSNAAKPNAVDKEFQKNMKLGVLFLNLGGPETLKDVEGFLYNLFADPDIIRLPPLLNVLQAPLAYLIAKRRAPKSSKAYESIGGGSPIVKYTREQSRLVEETLRRKGFEQARCYFAMRYWHPFTEDVLRSMQEDEVNTVVVVPLYPHYSVSTSGSSLKLLQEIFYKNPQTWGADKVVHTVVPAWYQRPGYVRTMAKLVVEKVALYSEEEMRQGLHVLFSAHGVPESYIIGGDPYQKQITECVALVSAEVSKQLASDETRPPTISAELGLKLAGEFSRSFAALPRKDTVLALAQRKFQSVPTSSMDGRSSSAASAPHTPEDIAASDGAVKPVQFHLSFQSRVGPVQWLRPYTDDMIRQLGEEEKVKNLIVVPVSFVSEHIETLEEIDMEYRELAEECGVTKWTRVPAMNTDPDFIADLADLVVDALNAPVITVAEAASKTYTDVMLAAPPATAAATAAAAASSFLVEKDGVRKDAHHAPTQKVG